MQVREVRREAGNRKQVVAVKWTVRGPLNTNSPDWQGRGGEGKINNSIMIVMFT